MLLVAVRGREVRNAAQEIEGCGAVFDEVFDRVASRFPENIVPGLQLSNVHAIPPSGRKHHLLRVVQTLPI